MAQISSPWPGSSQAASIPPRTRADRSPAIIPDRTAARRRHILTQHAPQGILS